MLFRAASLLSVVLLLAGCPAAPNGSSGGGASGGPQAPAEPTAAERTEGKQVFETRCAACHGMKGLGDGPASTGLDPKPRNFSDASWQDSVDDAYLEKIIKYGGAAVGKSPAMPSNPDLSSKPGVVAAIREHVRSLRQ